MVSVWQHIKMFVIYASGQNLPLVKFIFLLPGNGKDYGNEFLKKKNIHWDVPFWLLHGKLQVPSWKHFWSFDSNKRVLNQLPVVA